MTDSKPGAGTGVNRDVTEPLSIDITPSWREPDTAPSASFMTQLNALLCKPRNYGDREMHAEGGMGVILRARDLNISRTVAMKVIKDDIADPGFILRFVDEARITGQLEHPNIVPVHEAGVNERGEVFYTMKFVKGTTLKKVLTSLAADSNDALAKYPIPALLTIFQKVCDAIAFAHSRGVIHRDLKPENIMLGDYGEVLVMDWGLAKILRTGEAAGRRTGDSPSGDSSDVPAAGAVSSPRSIAHSMIAGARDESDSATKTGAILGTPRYMAPEQATGDIEHMDARTDIYALGAILHEILALRPAIAGKNAEEIISNVVGGNIAPLPLNAELKHCPGGRIPESLAAVARKALALKPVDRYATVTALQAEITRYQTGFATSAENAGLGKQIALLVKRNKGIALTAAAAWLIITALAVWFVLNVTQERNKAEKALTDLRASAPAYFAEARALVENQKLEEALEKIASAIALQADHADFHLLRANTLETLQRLPEAILAYRRVLEIRPADATARANVELSEKLLAQNSGRLPLTRDRQTMLLDALVAQNRTAESLFLGTGIGRATDVSSARLQQQLKIPMAHPKWKSSRLSRQTDGNYWLDLSDIPVPDASILRGLPVSILDLARTGVTDLSALKGMSLVKLYVNDTEVRDLSPIKGMPLIALRLSASKVEDLAPLAGLSLQSLEVFSTKVKNFDVLRGMPLETLAVSSTAFSDLSMLQGMPLSRLLIGATAIKDISLLATFTNLTQLGLDGIPVTNLAPILRLPLRILTLADSPIPDVSPLAACRTLEYLEVPRGAHGIEALRALPNLKIISYDKWWIANAPKPAEFWAEFDRSKGVAGKLEQLRADLTRSGVTAAKVASVKFADDGMLDLDLSKQPIRNLDFVAGRPVRTLRAGFTEISDLTPLRGAPIQTLSLYYSGNVADLSPLADCKHLSELLVNGTLVADLAPLAKLPLTSLGLTRAPVRDLHPLKDCMTLRELRISMTQVTDCTPIAGLRLTLLHMGGSTPIRDLSPLAACTTLENIHLPEAAAGIEALRKLPNLKRISFRYDEGIRDVAQTADEFWADYDRSQAVGKTASAAIQKALREQGVAETNLSAVRLTLQGTLDLQFLPITNLTFLHGLPVKTLILNKTNIRDLTPLRGLPLLETLKMSKVPVDDLSPLHECMTLRYLGLAGSKVSCLDALVNLKLTFITLGECPVQDVSPLARIETLQQVQLPAAATNVATLRAHPQLRRLSYVYNTASQSAAHTTAEFWAEYDAQKKK